MSQPFRLMSYNPVWEQDFEQAKSSILQATAGWLQDIQHIGGTSVPGCIARPVIDLMAGLKEMQALSDVCDLIEGLNYRRVETPAWCDQEFCAMLSKPRSGESTHTVLVVKHGMTLWNGALSVRDHLRADANALQELTQLKSEHYHSACSAAQDMAAAKSEFFESLTS